MIMKPSPAAHDVKAGAGTQAGSASAIFAESTSRRSPAAEIAGNAPAREIAPRRSAPVTRPLRSGLFALAGGGHVRAGRHRSAHADAVAVGIDDLELDETVEHALRPANQRSRPPHRIGQVQQAVARYAQIDGPALFLRVSRPRARRILQHHLGAIASEYREAVWRVRGKWIGVEAEGRDVPVDASTDVGDLQDGDGPLEAHGYSRSSVLRGNISSGVTPRGRIF